MASLIHILSHFEGKTMANVSVYFEALATFSEPATVKQVYAKAVEMFGNRVTGDRGSCRQCLDRYVLRGEAEKAGRGLYLVSMAYVDPVSQLATQNRVLQTEVDRPRQRIKELEATA
jgi:hypothetical protein